MRFHKLHILMLLVASVFINGGCANESIPQGGKKDESPPEVKLLTPKNKSVNFRGNRIEMRFNEFIRPSGFSQTVVSPAVDPKPEIKIHGKNIVIKLNSSLKDSTTYTLNFADDIQDLNESNTLENFTYVFSTGSYIDSMVIYGTATDAKTGKPLKGCLVALYYAEDSINIRTGKPIYFSKSDIGGNYKIENVKSGEYYIYGLKDENYNYMYDQPNEAVGFLNSSVYVDKSTPQINLLLFQYNIGKLRLTDAVSIRPGLIRFCFNGPVNLLKLENSLSPADERIEFNQDKDTINYWFSDYYSESAKITLTIEDTLSDTLSLELKTVEKDSIYTRLKNKYTIDKQLIMSYDSSAKSFKQSLYKPLKLLFSHPITEISKSAKPLLVDESGNSLEVSFRLDSLDFRLMYLDFTKSESSSYTLTVPSVWVKDIFGSWNTADKFYIFTDSKESYGTIKLSFTTEKPSNYIINIFNVSGELERSSTVTDSRDFELRDLPEGKYTVSVVEDLNRNGKWDNGDFLQKIQPEKVYYFKDVYTVKGGWDLDIQIKL